MRMLKLDKVITKDVKGTLSKYYFGGKIILNPNFIVSIEETDINVTKVSGNKENVDFGWTSFCGEEPNHNITLINYKNLGREMTVMVAQSCEEIYHLLDDVYNKCICISH